jgi:flagellar biosynthesis/type III secretory pathway protein FliH
LLVEEMILSDTLFNADEWVTDALLQRGHASRYQGSVTLEPGATPSRFVPWVAPRVHESVQPDADVVPAAAIADATATETTPVPAAAQGEDDPAPAAAEPGRELSEQALEEIRQQAFELGKQWSAGAAQERQRALEERLGTMLDTLAAARVDFLDFQHALIELARFMALQIVRAELHTDADWLQRLVHTCITEVRSHGDGLVQVRLSPADFSLLQPRFASLEGIRLERDDALERGDIDISMGATRITQQVEAQLRRVCATLCDELTRTHSSAQALLGTRDDEVQDS